MTPPEPGNGATPDVGIFEALYQGERPGPFDNPDVTAQVIPWDIGAPQPIIVELEQTGEIVGPVLEAGCGLGENALFLAEHGYEITAFDISPTVIRQDRDKARARGICVDFLVSDATTLEGVEGRYRTVIDSALMHCLDQERRQRYLAAVHGLCEPGARLHVLCFSDAMPMQLPGPSTFSEDDVRRNVADGWVILRLQRRDYTSAHTVDTILRMVAADGRPSVEVDALAVDHIGRILLPIWQITAERV